MGAFAMQLGEHSQLDIFSSWLKMSLFVYSFFVLFPMVELAIIHHNALAERSNKPLTKISLGRMALLTLKKRSNMMPFQCGGDEDERRKYNIAVGTIPYCRVGPLPMHFAQPGL